jgi:hypothetical protein
VELLSWNGETLRNELSWLVKAAIPAAERLPRCLSQREIRLLGAQLAPNDLPNPQYGPTNFPAVVVKYFDIFRIVQCTSGFA